jgi:nucleotide-binding universal stress UspA family protein
MTHQPIVVGFDNSPSSRQALGWALRTAQGRGADVLLVHAAKAFPPLAVGHGTYVALSREIATEAGQATLQAGILLAAKRAPEVTVTTLLLEDAPAAALLSVLDRAEMVAVGSRGLGGFSELVIGSTSLKHATHAPCPVVVVRDEASDAEAGPEAGRVVVGVDGPEHVSSDALAFAFDEASSRHTGLTVLHAWQEPFYDLPGRGGPIPKQIQLEQFEANQRRWLTEYLAGWQEKYPDVEVKVEVLSQNPAAVLVAASSGAELLVMGSHGHGGPHSVMMLGSVTHAVLHHAHCPVAVVGHR